MAVLSLPRRGPGTCLAGWGGRAARALGVLATAPPTSVDDSDATEVTVRAMASELREFDGSPQ
ncbi:hypothetical protein EDF60_0402 [Leucobacter luti]|nr:hypothetical protein [Leucobacter luti]TCK45177.1 hypothetical protein EDF60_0402 [Leucobacter luti]